MLDDLFYTALWRASVTTDDYGNLVAVLGAQYSRAFRFYEECGL